MSRPGVPLWLKWVLTLLLFAAVTVSVVIFAHRQGSATVPYSGGGNQPYVEDPVAAARADREGQLVQQQDQAVHRAPLSRSLTPTVALERAILGDVRRRIALNDIRGPVAGVNCAALARRETRRLRFRCQARAGGFRDPFVGVADLRSRALAWCKDDSAAVDPSVQAPLSPACTT